MGWVHEIPHSAGLHMACPCLHELGASAADMVHHLVQPTLPAHESHIPV
jgi:hypothetical protein